MAKKAPGLTKRGQYWQINKIICGIRVYESTGTGNREEAERYLNWRIEEIRKYRVYGERKQWKFFEAGAKYLREETKKSLKRDAVSLKKVMPYIGELPLEQIHMGTLSSYIVDQKKLEIKNVTINRDLGAVRHILMLAARLWRDDNGKTWLSEAPLIQLLPSDERKPYPITWDEQSRLVIELPDYLENMVLFALNTGCRESEICGLKWQDEIKATSLFILPGIRSKNGEERIIPLNSIAKRVVNDQRGKHDVFVFTKAGQPRKRINSHDWRNARKRAGIEQFRVHDLRHTFGRRLRAADVSFEDRQDLLGHRSTRITTHYSKAEVQNLMDAVEKLVSSGCAISVLRVVK